MRCTSRSASTATVDRVEELPELDAAMAPMQLADERGHDELEGLLALFDRNS